jgi:Ca-activated chloride channel family protein
MEAGDQNDEPQSEWQRRTPAWLISLAVHLLVLILGTLFIKCDRTPVSVDEADRRIAVVLAQRTAETTSYFADDKAAIAPSVTADGSQAAPEAALAGSQAGGGGSNIGLAIPTGPPPLLPGISLPQLPGAIAPAEGLVGKAAPGGPAKRASILPGFGDAEILAADAAIPREVIATGPTAQLALFGSAPAEGRSFVFVIDRSKSMGGAGLGAIQAAAAELKAHVGNLTDEQTFQVVAYNQSAVYFTDSGLVPATKANQQRVVKYIEDLAAYGQTEHTRGLLAALRLKPEVIFLLTDGGDPEMNLGNLRVVREACRGRTSIHCVHFGRGPRPDGGSFLMRLAEENRGSYTYIDMTSR